MLTTTQHSALGDLHRFGSLLPAGARCERGTRYGFSIRTLNALVEAGLARWDVVEFFPAIVPTSRTCTYCRETAADPGFDRCRDCRTWRDEEWCELNGHPHGVPVSDH